jgi:hypothetical protein
MRPGRDPATLRAIADELDREARVSERRSHSLFAFAQEAPTDIARSDRRESARGYEGRGLLARAIARRLRTRATRSERS